MIEVQPEYVSTISNRNRLTWRFMMPAVLFVILAAVVGLAVYTADITKKDANEKTIVTSAMWAEARINELVTRLINDLNYLTDEEAIYESQHLERALVNMQRSSPSLVQVFKGRDLNPTLPLEGQVQALLNDITVTRAAGLVQYDGLRQKALIDLIKPSTDIRMMIKSDATLGPFDLGDEARYLILATVSQDGKRALFGVLELQALLYYQMPKWARDYVKLEITDLEGESIVSSDGPKNVDIFSSEIDVQVSVLELPGLNFQLRAYSPRGKRIVSATDPLYISSAVLLVLLAVTFYVLWRDSRRRLEVEDKLREEKLFRQSMQDSMAVGLRVWDLYGVIRYVNPAFCKMVGYGPEELIGVPQPLPYWPSKNTEEYKTLVANVISGNAPPEGFETTFQHKHGHMIDVLIVEAPLRDGKGEHTGWMSSIIDITDRKKSEALVDSQREKLEAASRFALVGEVASNIAHELNQPLATMVSLAQAGMNLTQKAASSEMYMQLFEKLRNQAQRAGRVVGTVQNLVRRRKPMREQVRVEEVIESIRFMVTSTASQYGVKLNFNIQGGATVLHIDRIMVEQALVNLVKNAAEAFTAAQYIRNVWIEARQITGSFAFSVRDDGPGFSLNNMEKLFESLVSTKPDGLGLGLSLCRTVAEAHGGRLKAEPVSTGGTCFTLDLPMALREHQEGEFFGHDST